jgi:hypothetical protein
MNEEEVEEKATEIAEWVILKALPGDLIIVRPPQGWYAEECARLREGLQVWGNERGLSLHWLVLPPGSDIGTLHTMTDEELARAGAGDFPGHGIPGALADDSLREGEAFAASPKPSGGEEP